MLSEALIENEQQVSFTEKSKDDESFLDVVIHLDDGSLVKIHSIVLAASSELFLTVGQVGLSISHYNRGI